mmetsp:Transcript_32903/g.65257  ORF Transcript_32903/g.65257 Transcript_32903/m.65257 type:complete len:318 (+) Transcript_32903:359-1312(+)
MFLVRAAEHVHAVGVDGLGPVLHLPIHEGAGRQLQECHQLVEVQCGSQVERHDVIEASALIAVLHGHAAFRVTRGLRRHARALAHTNGKVGLAECDLDHSELLSRLVRQNLRGRSRRDAVLGHISRQGQACGAGDIHRARYRLFDEFRQQLAVVTVEANALEPAVEDRGLVLPILRHGWPIDHNVGKVDVAHVVPDPAVGELHAPLPRQISAHLMADLLAALVHDVGQVLPSDFPRVHVEDAARRGHVPSGSVPRPHVQDHVHVLHGEGCARVQELMVHIRAREEGVVFQEIHLRALLEVVGLALRQQVQAQVVVDA